MDIGCDKIMEFAMNIMANLVGKVTDEIMEYQIFCQSVQQDKSLGIAENSPLRVFFFDGFPKVVFFKYI